MRELKRSDGRVIVLASKSEKLTPKLIRQWARKVFNPAVHESLSLNSFDTDTELEIDFETMSIEDEAFTMSLTTRRPTRSKTSAEDERASRI